MTRKHFVALAEAIKFLPRTKTKGKGGHLTVKLADVINGIADACKSQNGGFDNGKFVKACLYGDEQPHDVLMI